MIRQGQSRHPAPTKLLKLGMMRAAFALGGRVAPRQTVERAARLFATPFASSRSRARAIEVGNEMERSEIALGGQTIAAYVWGAPKILRQLGHVRRPGTNRTGISLRL